VKEILMVHRDIAGYVDGDISWAGPTKKVMTLW